MPPECERTGPHYWGVPSSSPCSSTHTVNSLQGPASCAALGPGSKASPWDLQPWRSQQPHLLVFRARGHASVSQNVASRILGGCGYYENPRIMCS